MKNLIHLIAAAYFLSGCGVTMQYLQDKSKTAPTMAFPTVNPYNGDHRTKQKCFVGTPADGVISKTPQEIEASLQNFIIFQPNQDTIFPGSFVQGQTVASGNPALAPIYREPIKIAIKGSGSSRSTRDNVDPEAASVNEAIQAILEDNPDGYGAQIIFDITKVTTSEQALIELGLDAKWLGGSVSAGFKKETESTRNLYAVRFTQVYYTAILQLPPEGATPLLNNSRIWKDEADAFFNMFPAYISQVSYGRQLMMSVSSTMSKEELKATLKGTISNGAKSGKLSATVENLSKLQQSDIRWLISGGSNESALAVINTGDLAAWMLENPKATKDNPGAAISYTVKEFTTNKTLYVKKTTEFDLEASWEPKKTFTVTNVSWNVHNDGDSGFEGAGDFSWWTTANGTRYLTKGGQTNISSGTPYGFGGDTSLTLNYSDNLHMTAEMRDHDSGASGGDDVLSFDLSLSVRDLRNQTYSQRRSLGGDPDVTWSFKIHVDNDQGTPPDLPQCAE
jgi:hypothetical protein